MAQDKQKLAYLMHENICLRLHATLRDHDKWDNRNEDAVLAWRGMAWSGIGMYKFRLR